MLWGTQLMCMITTWGDTSLELELYDVDILSGALANPACQDVPLFLVLCSESPVLLLWPPPYCLLDAPYYAEEMHDEAQEQEIVNLLAHRPYPDI